MPRFLCTFQRAQVRIDPMTLREKEGREETVSEWKEGKRGKGKEGDEKGGEGDEGGRPGRERDGQ